MPSPTGDQQEKPIPQPPKPSHPLQSCALLRRLRRILVNPNALGSITIAPPHAVADAEDLALPDFSAALYGVEREAGGLEGGAPVGLEAATCMLSSPTPTSPSRCVIAIAVSANRSLVSRAIVFIVCSHLARYAQYDRVATA